MHDSDAGADLDAGDGDVDAGLELDQVVLTPCPAGWVEVPPDPEAPNGHATCDSWPDAGSAEEAGAEVARGPVAVRRRLRW